MFAFAKTNKETQVMVAEKPPLLSGSSFKNELI